MAEGITASQLADGILEIRKQIVIIPHDDILTAPTGGDIEIVAAPATGGLAFFGGVVKNNISTIYGNLSAPPAIYYGFVDSVNLSDWSEFDETADMFVVDPGFKKQFQPLGFAGGGQYDGGNIALRISNAAGNFTGGHTSNQIIVTAFYAIV